MSEDKDVKPECLGILYDYWDSVCQGCMYEKTCRSMYFRMSELLRILEYEYSHNIVGDDTSIRVKKYLKDVKNKRKAYLYNVLRLGWITKDDLSTKTGIPINTITAYLAEWDKDNKIDKRRSGSCNEYKAKDADIRAREEDVDVKM